MSDCAKKLPLRADVPPEDRWNLDPLFADDPAWEEALAAFEAAAPDIEPFKGTLGRSPARLCEGLDWYQDMNRRGSRLAYYAHLRVSEDVGDSGALARMARLQSVTTAFRARAAFWEPEIQAIPDATMAEWLAGPELAFYRLHLEEILRHKPHILSAAEERLLAMQSDFGQTARNGFAALTDVDMDFGEIETDEGLQPLTQGTIVSFMQHPDRALRRTAYHQFLAEYAAHRHTLASLYNGSVQLDVFRARARKHPSALEASLFNDRVPAAVYHQLIAAVRAGLPAVHRYFELRRRVLELDEIRIYDLRAPLVPDVRTRYSYDDAVAVVAEAVRPLGADYAATLEAGLRNGWVDRYENKGKKSGAFCAGPYDADPFILMNYKETVLNDVFTLAHEAGHAMHAWYSRRHQAYPYFYCSIFVAEVASTFNEHLVARHLMAATDDPALRAYLVNKQIDDLINTVFRQAMFAEYEQIAHAMVERNEPLTVDSLSTVYADLLNAYYGPEVRLEEHSPLEGLRIPHLYSAFYVYKYATGMAAAYGLYRQVITGGPAELERYLGFLKSGGSAYPLEQLQAAGVDMTSPEPVQATLDHFSGLVDELDQLLTAVPATAG